MTLKQLAAAAALALGALSSTSASAVILSDYSSAPGNVVENFSLPGLVSFDLNLVSPSFTTINFIIESLDLGAPLAFNAIVNNLFGAGIDRFALYLDNASFALIGSVEDGGFGSNPSASGGGNSAIISFMSPEFNFFSLGDPFASGATNWLLDISNLNAGDRFSLIAGIPEPGSLPLLLAGIGVATAMLRRRRFKE